MNFNRKWSHLGHPILINHQFYANEFRQDSTNNYLKLVLPGLVSERIATQLPIVLRDNSQMQQIFDTHLDTVKKQMADAAKEKVDQIVNEPEYHIINTAFFDSVRQKADTQLQQIEKTWQSRLEEFDTRRQEIDTIKSQVGTLKIITTVSVSLSVLVCAWVLSK
uniref:Uncharacterized protein n=2 Tax=root TaxID=1 RepID=A0A481YZG7_9VIRU|nr:MAG: hypothetical protein LCMAC202_05970 [Marseillevirus LCMAC202]